MNLNVLERKSKSDIDSAYKNYVIAAESNIKQNPKKSWSHINNIKGASPISKTMKYNGHEFNEPVDILNALNADYFSTSFAPHGDFLGNVD